MLKTLATLTRPPALLTAPADALTGLACLSALGLGYSPLSASYAIATSLLIYAGGMVMNDVFDAPLDALERPERPIPSQKISRAGAAGFGLCLHGLALLCAWRGGEALLTAGGGVLLMTYVYNGLLKESPLGPSAMALCRVGNLWIGASLAPELLSEPRVALTLPLSLSLCTGLYVYALTSLSRLEVHGGASARWWAWALGLTASAPLWLGLRLESLGLGGLACLYLLYTLSPGVRRLSAAQSPQDQASGARALVGRAVRGVALLNASWCLALGAWPSALALLSLSLSAGLVARRFATT